MEYPTHQLRCPNCKHTNFSGTMCPECGYQLFIEQTTSSKKTIYSIKRATVEIGKIYRYCPHCSKKL